MAAVIILIVVLSQSGGYTQINAKKAKEMMDSGKSYILLDVRTESEFREKRIKGAILIPYDQVNEKAEGWLKDKNATILVYCRSGNRSKIAAKALADMGYTNVYEFGGINDWSYGTISG